MKTKMLKINQGLKTVIQKSINEKVHIEVFFFVIFVLVVTIKQ